MTLKVLDLFSGIGGFTLGLTRAGMKTIAFCEIEPYCQKILNRHWPDIPLFPDIKKLSANDLPDEPDVVCGGYPCQPFSVAGQQRGTEDHRHLWPEMFRLVKETKPRYVIAENVAGHINMGLDNVLSDLEDAGYTPWPFVIPACALNARHRRDRVWIMGHAQHHGPLITTIKDCVGKTGQRIQERAKETKQSKRAGQPSDYGMVANTPSKRIQRHRPSGKQKPSTHAPEKLSVSQGERVRQSFWEVEPNVGRVVDGLPNRVDRIKALGNAVVPQIPQILGTFIIQHHKETHTTTKPI